MLLLREQGIPHSGTTYAITTDPVIDRSDGTKELATCVLCSSYQICQNRTDTGEPFCTIRSSYFFDFGWNQGDSTVPKGKNRKVVKEKAPADFPVGGKMVKKIWISMNGLVSFGSRFGSFRPNTLPRRNKQLLCGYWADFLLANDDVKSNVWYHAYEKSDSMTAADTDMLAKGKSQVELYGSNTGFEPTYMLVVTYEEIPPDGTDVTTTTERVNFQIAVITDGFYTYGMIIYASGGMLWDENADRKVTIGYLSENLPIDTNRPDTVLGNTNQRGLWFFELGDVQQNSEQKCLNWHTGEVEMESTYLSLAWSLPRCPCNFIVLLIDGRFYPYSLQDGVVCYMLLPFFGQFGKTCCYNGPGTFVRNRPLAGSFQLYHPLLNPIQHFKMDEEPKKWCCEESYQCQKYYEVRPDVSCQASFVFIIAIGRGDPHITTMDGFTFPFNAIGEFCLFKADGPTVNFELQGRTCQATSQDGNPADASIFCALVMQGNSSASALAKLQVELSLSGDALVVFINEQDVTTFFNEEPNYQKTVDGLTVRRVNNTLRATFSSGISVNVTVGFKLLTYEMAMVSNVSGARGLLGNMDTDPNNDFMFPNGTVLPNTTSDRDLFEYGKTWAVTNSTSLFYYTEGRSTMDYTNNSFVPIFLSEVNETVKANAYAECGGEQNIGCVFDFIATGNKALAVGTKTVKEEVDTSIASAENNNPELTGPLRLNVTVNVTTEFSFNASDVEDAATPNYTIVEQPSGNFVFDVANQTAQWKPNGEKTKLEVVVEDSNGARSPSLQVEIVQCSGCSNHGTCNFEELREQDTVDQTFREATCDCETYWSGDNCETDFDACEDEPCPLLTTCIDLSPEEHEAQGVNGTGYNCTDCPTGYVVSIKEDGPVCDDVDECTKDKPCDAVATCTNTQGSFYCTCNSGYRLDSQDPTACRDIDECAEWTDECEQTCTNTDGAYTCGCLPGYTQNKVNTFQCDKEQIDPCENITNSCSYACTNETGVAQCLCPSGFTLTANKTSCEDIDECAEKICSQNCENFDGGFNCSCYVGYKLDADKVTCSACPPNTFGDNCAQTCDCRGRGTCDSVRGCLCNSAWTGPTCTLDVDECLSQPCPDEQICVNTNGSYVCNCPDGFAKINDTHCDDINECANAGINTCEQVCTNTYGSFVCDCVAGYTKTASGTCLDVDECTQGISGCEQLCTNFPGSANCACQQGFYLNDDRKTCSKEETDPCQSLGESKSCSYGCQVTVGAAECYCPRGFKLGTDGSSCIDINECESVATNLCNQTCTNTNGSYTCACAVGFTLDNNQRDCTVCDEYHWGDDCANDCNCSPLNTERCDPVTGCVCNSGWLGATCDQDRDDCESSPCPVSSECVNLPGSFRCDCPNGYEHVEMMDPCTDENECNENPCDQTCNNTVGSYVCSCGDGFVAVGDKCNDIDECLNNPCDQICRNTVGGFACECREGFQLNTTTRTTCYASASTSCMTNNTCDQQCVVVGGNETCLCRTGYTQNTTDPNLCDDIDECDAGSNPCVNGTCTNTDGGFTCSCSNGTFLLSDGATCQVCPDGKFGKECAETCTCDTANTESCDVINGTCACKSGWKGDNCDQDIDECTDTPNICASVSNSKCENKNGSYSCSCVPGFSKSDGLCSPCDDVHYGAQCLQLCPCERANTLSCDDVTGTCSCSATWTGDNCTEDVNECLPANGANPCFTDQFENCTNLVGGYRCDCVSGYERKNPGDNCTDINECEDPDRNTCVQTKETCTNFDGGYNCSCSTGYSGTAGSCADVNECNDPALNNCTDRQDCSNTEGSYTCPCKSTYVFTNGDCVDVNECSVDAQNNCTSTENCRNTVGGFFCVCKPGYFRNDEGVCTIYRKIPFDTTFIMEALESLSDSNTPYYQTLRAAIEAALTDFFRNSIGAPFHAVIVTRLRTGSVVSTADLQIDTLKTDNVEGLAARAFEDLLNQGKLEVNGTDRNLTSVQVAGTNLSQSNVVCDAFNAITTCENATTCQVDSGLPSCRPVTQDDDDDTGLIIGLGVGIPLFFIAAIVVGAIIYLCVKRQKSSASSDQRADASEHRFPSIFAGQLATKGSWGAAQRYSMYSPDNVSVSHASDSSGEGQLLKGRRQGRSDFQDSAWYDNRGGGASASAVTPSSPRRDDGAGTEAATSNFSWEYMFRLLAPYRGGFEIQRPNVDPDPNPAYSPRSRGPKPDSMA
ncbi:uncharacterized protein LOC143276674 [Babylonia areolata]|uniref:uncharacterized protein LOC143276674 n=1 Tax=Babylonia areolata TaxID=304850 RepID=UPI003FD553B1